MKFLIYGQGYLGKHYYEFLTENGHDAVFGDADIANLSEVRVDMDRHQPDVVLNCAGRTGRPNVDWCEANKEETLHANVTGPLTLMKACHEASQSWGETDEKLPTPRLVHLGSGCVYDGDNDGKGFSEADAPNFDGSFYSRTKAWSETMLDEFPVLQLRLRMPIDANAGERNFISKITKYEKVISVANSMTVIEDLLKASLELIEKGETGIFNMTNPGAIDHETILKMYQEVVDPDFTYTLMSVEEMEANYTVAKRSNCILNTDKLASAGVTMRPIEEAIRDCLEKGFKK
jgi:3,5-epimerase/4-reductase